MKGLPKSTADAPTVAAVSQVVQKCRGSEGKPQRFTNSQSQMSGAAENIPKSKELFAKYREAMKERRSSSSSSSEGYGKKAKALVGIHYGAMIYDETQQKGVKKQYLPAPQVVDMLRSSTYLQVLQQGRDIFFSDESEDVLDNSLCGTSGTPFDIINAEEWVLGDFLKTHGYQPSKLRLYILYNPVTHDESNSYSPNYFDSGDEIQSESGSTCRSPSLLASAYSPVTPTDEHDNDYKVTIATCRKCKCSFEYGPHSEIYSFKANDGVTYKFGVCPECQPS